MPFGVGVALCCASTRSTRHPFATPSAWRSPTGFVTALAFVAVVSVQFSRVAHRVHVHGKPDTEVQIVDLPGSEVVLRSTTWVWPGPSSSTDDEGMSPELLTGLVGLLGASLGAAGAVWAGSVTAKSQRQQTRDQLDATHLRWKLDNKRDVYLQLLKCASLWQSASWELHNALSLGTDGDERAETRRRKVGRWQEFAAMETAAKVFTTDTAVHAAADRLQGTLLALDRVTEDRYHGRERSEPDNWEEAFRTRSQACLAATATLAREIETTLSLATMPPPATPCS